MVDNIPEKTVVAEAAVVEASAEVPLLEEVVVHLSQALALRLGAVVDHLVVVVLNLSKAKESKLEVAELVILLL